MQNKQKALLYIFSQANRSISGKELTKWSFLVKKETSTGGGTAFYDFLPYHYGPFSFGLYYDVRSLLNQNYLDTVDNKQWKLSNCLDIDNLTKNIKSSIKDDIEKVLSKYASQPIKKTVDYIYNKYPWFTINSKPGSRMKRPSGSMALYTAGYEGTQIDGFLNFLLHSGVERIIDVRKNPIARRYGFHKSTLNRLCNEVKIEYFHFPELGIPSSWRQDLNAQDDYNKLFNHYRAEILEQETGTIDKVAHLVIEKSTILICAEADHNFCHRSLLATTLANITNLQIKHLRVRA